MVAKGKGEAGRAELGAGVGGRKPFIWSGRAARPYRGAQGALLNAV